MADLTPEVMNALVQLMKGETSYDDISDDDLYQLAQASRRGQLTLHEIILKLRERGHTLAQIGERLGVTESAVSRWTKQPQPPGRRKQQ
ncbi:MAG: helix-turn-helix domain-containing protein [Pseudonocardia sp.]|nr:helix-turn-helix domain-containing protein [Pseudonocardia sp.]